MKAPRSVAHVDTMPHVEALSETELAARAGTTLEQVRRLAELGIVSSEPDGSYRLGSLQRIQLAESLERGGVPLDAVGKAIADGRLSFSFLELVTNPAGYSPKTYEVAGKEMGWTMEFVQQVHEPLGLPRPDPSDPIREDDAEMFAIGQFAMRLGVSDTQLCRALRVYGENLGRIGAAEASFFHDFIEVPLRPSGPPSGHGVPGSCWLHASHGGARGSDGSRAGGAPGRDRPVRLRPVRREAGQVAGRRSYVPLPRSSSGSPVLARAGRSDSRRRPPTRPHRCQRRAGDLP